jgi:hypothetical protein
MELEKYLNILNLITSKTTLEISKCKERTGKSIKLRNL